MILAVWLAGAACDGAVEGVTLPADTLPELTGRYVGGWNVLAVDTALVCGYGCYYPVLESVGCRVTTDLVMQGDRTFTGAFVIDSAVAGPGGSGVCDVAGTSWLQLATTGEIGNGVVHAGVSSGDLEFTIGAGTRTDLERLLGCTWLDGWSTWVVRGFWVGGGAGFTHDPESGSAFTAIPSAPDGRVDFRVECRGRVMRVQIHFGGER
jgi:hypothetical protein